jgi:protein arginine kinase
MKLSNLAVQPVRWLENLNDKSIVLSARVRLARNISGYIFPNRANEAELDKISKVTKESVRKALGRDALYLDMSELERIDRNLLVERHLISHDHASNCANRAVVFTSDEKVSVMINEEDHIRLQTLAGGDATNEAWRQADKVDSDIGKNLPYAFSEEFGFLTSCPTNAGTGMRCSVLVHVIGLCREELINGMIANLAKLGFVTRGLYGEGTKVFGHLFQISNQTTLGLDELSLIDKLKKITKQLVEQEIRARENMLHDNRIRVEDEIWRGYGILTCARSIGYQEVMEILSLLRMARSAGIKIPIDNSQMNSIMIRCQPAHLQGIAGREMGSSERDVARAEMIRHLISKGG